MSRWAGLFLVVGAMAGCTLFGHRAASAPDGGNSNEMLGQRSPTNASAYANASNPPVVAPPNAGPAADPPSVEPGRTVSAPPAPVAPSPSLDQLTAPLSQPHYMTQSLQNAALNTSTTPPAMPTPVTMPRPINQLPAALPPAQPQQNPAPAFTNPFRSAPPLPRPMTAQAPANWPPAPGQAVPFTAATPVNSPARNEPPADRGTVQLTSVETRTTPPQARLVGGIDAAPAQAPSMHMLPASNPAVEAHKLSALEPAIENAPITAAGIRLLNSKRFSLAYAVKDIGRSGLAGVELWYTQDGKTWQKHPSPLHHHSPYVIEVGDEDLYGFTLVAHSGSGVSTQVPKAGDLPQVWVEVDVTNPVVRLLGVEPGTGDAAGTVTVLWSATDKHLGTTPISIAYAERTEGPWQTVADKLPNDGRYVWRLSQGVPLQFYVRVQAKDLPGNVGEAVTAQPIVGDLAQPSIAILGVAPAARK